MKTVSDTFKAEVRRVWGNTLKLDLACREELIRQGEDGDEHLDDLIGIMVAQLAQSTPEKLIALFEEDILNDHD
jgi:hypothetical protein